MTKTIVKNGVTYTLDDYGYLTSVESKEPLNTLVIPTEVTGIIDGSFKMKVNGAEVKNPQFDVTFEEGRKVINNTLPGNLKGVKSVTLPKSLEIIGDNAFAGCQYPIIGLNNLNNLKKIGNFAFHEANIEPKEVKLQFNQNLDEIGYNAFALTKITEITFPNSLTKVSDYLCAGCSELKEVNLGNRTTEIGISAFNRAQKLESVNFADAMDLHEIGKNAFYFCESLPNKLYLGKGMQKVDSGAFENCKLEQVIFACPEASSGYDVKLGDNAFSNNPNLHTVLLSNKTRELGRNVFTNTKVQRLVIPEDSKLINADMKYENLPLHTISKNEFYKNRGIYTEAYDQRVLKNDIEAVLSTNQFEKIRGNWAYNSKEFQKLATSLEAYQAASQNMENPNAVNASRIDMQKKVTEVRNNAVDYLYAKIKQHAKGEYASELKKIRFDDKESKEEAVRKYLKNVPAEDRAAMFHGKEGAERFKMAADVLDTIDKKDWLRKKTTNIVKLEKDLGKNQKQKTEKIQMNAEIKTTHYEKKASK